jgi:succinate dehydrogenase/fumarate reductase flavoprotein subunit
VETTEVQLGDGRVLPVTQVHTLVIGSGAAGLNAAVQLRTRGLTDVLIVTEGLDKGTSINTGSDKQTYYKLALCGEDADAPRTMAGNYFSGGSMHGDLALVEAALSARGFLHLVDIGVPFPQDAYGQFVGYKTDHDPRRRATSIGPYTSREMCRALIRRVREFGIPVAEDTDVVSLLVADEDDRRRVVGALALDADENLVAFRAENVVLAVGGPGGLYKTSVYPEVQTGAIGLALMAGARAQNLPESQYGMASTKFRWNVSGTYMQVVPRFVSTEADGQSDPREFLREYFDTPGDMHSMVFLKGYQWPFDSRKAAGGSSIVDILVYKETVLTGRRVFLDFRENPEGFAFDRLSDEARLYLEKSQGLQDTPIARLAAMNPGAIALYREHGIDITSEPLEIAVCAQHNNGGLAANHWWESVNIAHLFPVGEVNGSHGAYRPGGAALNAGQVGGVRAADFIAARYADTSLGDDVFRSVAETAMASLQDWIETCRSAGQTWREARDAFQRRMSRAAAHIRSRGELEAAVVDARAQWDAMNEAGNRIGTRGDLREALRNRHLCFAHRVYLEAVLFAVRSELGSRGSALVTNPAGTPVHDRLGDAWNFEPESMAFRDKVQETQVERDGSVSNTWVACRPVPDSDPWFETAWAAFRKGRIYD